MEARHHETKTASYHWGAILAGAFVALGTWVMLYALGAAIGLAGAQAEQQGASAWTAVYTLVAPILALFVGGFAAGRGDRVKSKFDAAMYGLVVWGFAALLGSLSIGAVAGVLANAPNLPVGYTWAVFGSLFLSLIGAVLGAMAGVKGHEHHEPVHRTEVGTRRGEVYP